MSHVVYNFLADSLFLNKHSLEAKFANETDQRIEKELLDYRSHIVNNIGEIKAEIDGRASELNVFTSSTETPIELLKQTALYLNQYVIADPLFKLTNLETYSEQTISKHLGFRTGLNRNNIHKACTYLKEIVPMVVGDYVKVFPVTYHFEPPEEMPIKMPVNNNEDLLPKDLLLFFREHCTVSPMEQLTNNEGWAVLDGKDLTLGRAINIEFGDREFRDGFIYFLYETKVLEVNEESGIIRQAQYLPPHPPSQEVFDAWVTQSVNSSARNYFDHVFGEVYLAESMGTRYICESPFKNKLLSNSISIPSDIQSFTSTQMLNLDLPFLAKIDVDKLMQVRLNEADIFTNFRLELEKQFRELRLTKDERDLKLKTENIFHELNDVQGEKIRQKLNHIHKQMAFNAVLAVGGLAGTVTTGGVSIAAVAAAAAKGYKDYRDYVHNVRENPAFFLWKIKK